MSKGLRAPFPYFGGKSSVADLVWARFGRVKQYVEPFCGSAALLLAAPERASLEVIGDANLYVANFWRAVKCQPEEVWRWSDYPVSHVDLAARHAWLTRPTLRSELVAALSDVDWPGDAKAAGFWAWGQCCWIGSGWCERERPDPARGERRYGAAGGGPRQDTPPATSAGMGLQAEGLGQIPHAGNAGMGLQAEGLGQIPHAGNAGRGLQAEGLGQIPHASDAGRGLLVPMSPHAAGARDWLRRLAARLERVRVTHGAWDRCLNHHYGDTDTAVFLDPPYLAFEKLYSSEGNTPVASAVADWARDNAELRIALCGHESDYSLPGWDVVPWSRPGNTYGGAGTKDAERIWFSPACLQARGVQASLFDRRLP